MRLPFLVAAGLGQTVADVVLVVGRHALQAADRDGLVLHPHAPARRSHAVTGAPGIPKDIGFPIDHVGVAVSDPPAINLMYSASGVCADKPTGNPRPCGSSQAPNVGGFLLIPLHARLPRVP